MMKGDYLVSIMESEDVPFSDTERLEAVKRIQASIDTGKIEFLRQEGIPVGFVTYKEGSKGIFIEYCFLYKNNRSKTSLLGLRKTFRSMSDNFRWKSRRRGRLVNVR